MSRRTGFVNMSAEDFDRHLMAATRRDVGRGARIKEAHNDLTSLPFIFLVIAGVILTQFGDFIFANTVLRKRIKEEETE